MRIYDKDKLYSCPGCGAFYTGIHMQHKIKTFGSCEQCYIYDGYEFKEVEDKRRKVK